MVGHGRGRQRSVVTGVLRQIEPPAPGERRAGALLDRRLRRARPCSSSSKPDACFFRLRRLRTSQSSGRWRPCWRPSFSGPKGEGADSPARPGWRTREPTCTMSSRRPTGSWGRDGTIRPGSISSWPERPRPPPASTSGTSFPRSSPRRLWVALAFFMILGGLSLVPLEGPLLTLASASDSTTLREGQAAQLEAIRDLVEGAEELEGDENSEALAQLEETLKELAAEQLTVEELLRDLREAQHILEEGNLEMNACRRPWPSSLRSSTNRASSALCPRPWRRRTSTWHRSSCESSPKTSPNSRRRRPQS